MYLLPIFCISLLIQFSPAFSFTNITNFSYPSFTPNNTPNITYMGNASASSDGVIDITTNKADKSLFQSAGRAFYANPIRLYDQDTGSIADFVTYFTFTIKSLDNNIMKADGITFFLSRANSTLPANASCGGCLGLMNETLNNSTTNQIVAVEFDTYPNPWDPQIPNHMGIDVNSFISNVTVPWKWNASLGKFDGEAWVWYNSSTKILSARLTNKNPQADTESEWNIFLPIDLSLVLPELVVVGFTGATGTTKELNQISSWNFTSQLSTPDPPPTGSPQSPPPDTAPTNLSPIKRTKHKLFPILATSLTLLLLGTIVITTMTVWIRRRRMNNRKKKEIEENVYEQDDGEDDEIGTTTSFEMGPRRFSYGELAVATNCFSEEERLGQGGFGSVYRGVLKGTHEVVAVKRLSKDSSQGKKEYMSEVTVISRLRHRNLVKLIGWCHERSERLLVYEYMEGGSLDSYLFGHKTAQVLPWERRMRIALDIANALLYLHEEWEQCVIHRDVKTSNVMMDSALNGRLGDFGLARLVNHGFAPETTMMAGTVGYIAPECLFTGKVSKESDVYSYGVVLLEIACGRRALRSVGEKGTRLVEWVWGLYGSDSLLEAIDERLGFDFNREEAECMMMVGLWCALPDMESRPTIREAIQTLRFQAKLPKLPPKMPTLVFYVPPTIEDFSVSLSTSTGATTTSVTTAGSSTKEWSMEESMLHSHNEEIGSS